VATGLVRDWNFEVSRPTFVDWRNEHAGRMLRRLRRPVSHVLRPVSGGATWAVYFLWSPDGRLLPQHEFTLRRLRDESFRVAVICAAPDPASVPQALSGYSEALYWKDLPGYDFSGYTLGLEEIAAHAEGADVLLLNDSVFGPLHPIGPLLGRWDLTGFTASNVIQNHIQSYAFSFRAFDRKKLAALRAIYPRSHCFNEARTVIACQEVPQARIASRCMSVGAHWYATGDPTLEIPLKLVDDAFPFLKKSLVEKYSGFIEPGAVQDCLRRFNHPAVA
jgi:hypothetical protein